MVVASGPYSELPASYSTSTSGSTYKAGASAAGGGIPWDKISQIAGPLAQGFMTANQPTAISPFQVYTPDMLDRAIASQQYYQNLQNQFYGTPYTGPGGTSVTQATTLSPQQVKAEAYTNYLISKGYTKENAQKETNKIIAQKKLTFYNTGNKEIDKGFKQYINEGNAPGLSVGKGKIKAKEKVQGGGIQTGAPGIMEGVKGLGAESLAAAQGLPGMFGQDVARSLQARQQLQNSIGGLLGQGFTQSGLTPQEQMSYDAMKAKYLQDFGDLYKDTMQRTTGELVDSGFASSSLAKDALQRGAYDAQSRFLTGAMGELAQRENDLINSRVARQSQNLTNLLNTFGTLGANQGIGSVLGGFISPAQGGYLSEAQNAALLAGMQQNQAVNRQTDQSMMNEIFGRSTTVVPGAGGSGGDGGGVNWGGGAKGALGGAATGASIGSVVPGLGTGIGAGIGAVVGGLGGLFGR